MRVLVRVLPTLMSLVVGATAFLLSYVALRDVAIETGAVPAHLAWAVPVCIDGGILSGSAVIWSAAHQRKRRDPLAFLTVIVLLATSVVINVHHAGPTLLAQWIAALPPIVLLACLELVAAQHRRDLQEEGDLLAGHDTSGAGEGAGRPPVGASVAAAQQVTQTAAAPAAALPQIAAPGSESATRAAVVTASTPAPQATAVPPHSAPPPPSPTKETPTATQEATLSSVVFSDSSSGSGPVRAVAATSPAEPRVTVVADLAPKAAVAPGAADAVELPAPVAQNAEKPGETAFGGPVSSAGRRQLRVNAASPDEASEVNLKDRIVQRFNAHVAGGGDPQDPGLAGRLSSELDASPQYVRKTLKPLRDAAAAS